MIVGRFLSGLHGEGDVIAWSAASQAAFQALAAARLANHISQSVHVNPILRNPIKIKAFREF